MERLQDQSRKLKKQYTIGNNVVWCFVRHACPFLPGMVTPSPGYSHCCYDHWGVWAWHSLYYANFVPNVCILPHLNMCTWHRTPRRYLNGICMQHEKKCSLRVSTSSQEEEIASEQESESKIGNEDTGDLKIKGRGVIQVTQVSPWGERRCNFLRW